MIVAVIVVEVIVLVVQMNVQGRLTWPLVPLSTGCAATRARKDGSLCDEAGEATRRPRGRWAPSLRQHPMTPAMPVVGDNLRMPLKLAACTTSASFCSARASSTHRNGPTCSPRGIQIYGSRIWAFAPWLFGLLHTCRAIRGAIPNTRNP